jgi:thiamine kinase-like enzyme
MMTTLRSFFLSSVVVISAFTTQMVVAHDSINSEARKNYMAKLQDLHTVLNSKEPASARAKAQYQIATTVDEIRDLFNQDMISHGIVKGLETSLLLNELSRTPDKLEASPKTGLYLSHLKSYREAIKLDPKAPFVEHARFMLLKSHFYDSFSDNPLAPFSQSKEELIEMIGIGEGLLKSKNTLVNAEEVRFILGIHYLQAINQQVMPKDDGQKKFKKMVQELQKDFPQSLKLLTLEALAQQ